MPWNPFRPAANDHLAEVVVVAMRMIAMSVVLGAMMMMALALPPPPTKSEGQTILQGLVAGLVQQYPTDVPLPWVREFADAQSRPAASPKRKPKTPSSRR